MSPDARLEAIQADSQCVVGSMLWMAPSGDRRRPAESQLRASFAPPLAICALLQIYRAFTPLLTESPSRSFSECLSTTTCRNRSVPPGHVLRASTRWYVHRAHAPCPAASLLNHRHPSYFCLFLVMACFRSGGGSGKHTMRRTATLPTACFIGMPKRRCALPCGRSVLLHLFIFHSFFILCAVLFDLRSP